MIDIEICCNSVASAKQAKAGGASRIELCRDLECGGLTPSDEDIAYCANHLGLRTHVLVRPRAGNFCYTDDELLEIRRTVERCRELGAAAVVVGFLTPEGLIDYERTSQIVAMATPMEVTFHRAFDEVKQPPLEALVKVAESGCTRLLTSGCAPTAPQGSDVVRQLQQAGLIRILAGSGVTPSNVAQLIMDTRVREVHSSCKQRLPDGTQATSATLVGQLIAQVQMVDNLFKSSTTIPVVS